MPAVAMDRPCPVANDVEEHAIKRRVSMTLTCGRGEWEGGGGVNEGLLENVPVEVLRKYGGGKRADAYQERRAQSMGGEIRRCDVD